MRRTAQASVARDGRGIVSTADLQEALDDMLFTGGKLNIKLWAAWIEPATRRALLAFITGVLRSSTFRAPQQ